MKLTFNDTFNLCNVHLCRRTGGLALLGSLHGGVRMYTSLTFRIRKGQNRQAVGMAREEPCGNVMHGPVPEAPGLLPLVS